MTATEATDLAATTASGLAVDEASEAAGDAAEHLAAAIGTDAWPVARDGAAALLGEAGRSATERVQAWAAEAERLDGAARDDFLFDTVPGWEGALTSALTGHPQRSAQARQFTEMVRALLTSPGAAETAETGATQVATATDHGTVNAVQNGNIYHQVVLGQVARPRRMSRGAAGAVAGVAGLGAAGAGVAVARRSLAEEAAEAGANDLPQGPLADPAASVHPPDATGGPPSAPPATGAGGSAGGGGSAGAGASVSGGSVATSASTVIGKAASLLGVGAGGVGVPAVVTVVTVVVVAVTTVTVVVTRNVERASCDSVVNGRSAPTVLAEAARRTGLTSYRFTVTRGTHRVIGAADPRARSAWFTQQVGEGPAVAGTIERGKVTLPKATTAPAGADNGLVRPDGAFTDAVDPTAAARLVQSVSTAERAGCDFTGTLAGPRGKASERARATRRAWGGPAGTEGNAPAAEKIAPAAEKQDLTAATNDTPSPPLPTTPPTAPPAPEPSTPILTPKPSPPTPPALTSAPFTARIDTRGRLVRLTVSSVGQPGGSPALTARYSHFGLDVTPSVPPTPSGAASSGPGSTDTAQVNGDWDGTWTIGSATGSFDAKLKADGDRLTGRLTVLGTGGCNLGGALTGTLKDNRITFGSGSGTAPITFTGTVHGDSMKGKFATGCRGAAGWWDARRAD
ncbi:hypothetical protein [Streptomyces flavofungini]|uniref:Uncharacterized protein n=1 Tax=Streptomyces flavofungini TaxID=68200 RepID=A0ABS0X703_9ACTN|nr:hypothetical protein [Streptomyces flavofungini]MBJ3808991.1 hypothetical protein [Streptomyces flavofungini]